MMDVKVAESAGFCFGVTKAVDTVSAELDRGNQKLYTYGPIIHNMEVVRGFEERGVHVIDSVDHLPKLSPGERPSVVIRSHGISRGEQEVLENAGFQIIDATCPFVKKIHRYVEQYSQDGYFIMIVGNPDHPEVKGIRGWSKTEDVAVLQTAEEIENFMLSEGQKLCVVAQTTFNLNKFQEFVEILNKKGYDITVLNTICNATAQRQKEARVLAASVDAMIVIGDRHSSNSQKLFEISKKECENTYYIQTSNDMDYDSIRQFSSVGITAGASTPNNIIQEVSKHVRKL